jgi:hypothetical protein
VPNSPGFEIKGIVGFNAYGGVIVYGGNNSNKVAYINDYASGNWISLPDSDKEIGGITGNNHSGPVIFSERQIARLEGTYQDPGNWNWDIAPAPFDIKGIVGANIGGILAFGGDNSNQVAYIPNYQGNWVVDDRFNVDFPIKAIAGNNETGPIILHMSGEKFFIMPNYIGGWQEKNIQDHPATIISGSNNGGIVLLCNE